MKPSRASTGPDAVELIEEAVHLLRRAPARAWAVYVAGTIPFVSALLFFWAHTTWFRPSAAALAWSALGLATLYAWMKAAQSEFCAQLMALRMGTRLPDWSWRRIGGFLAAQLALQPWALIAVFVASVVAVPFGWVFAYSQIVTVIGRDEALHAASVREAKRWPAENHFALLLISGVALCVWCNFASAIFVVPWLANRLLGIENMFHLSGVWLLNTTFLASVTGLTWLATDPLLKAFYTLWVFNGRSRTTGDDVRIEFRRSGVAPAVAAMFFAMIVLGSGRVVAAEAPRPAARAVNPVALDHAIDHVLAGSDFAWRLRPLPPPPGQQPKGPLARFINEGMDLLRSAAHTVGRWIRSVVDWIERQFSSDGPSRQSSGSIGAGLARLMLYLFIGAAVLLLLWLISLLVGQGRRASPHVVSAQPIAPAAPDLRDATVHAAQLPADGWLALARAEIANGEWRLALRALYLATLARLAAEGLIRLASFKTNLDYERELRRRALSRAELIRAFAQRRRAFEDAWYGHAAATEADVRGWLTELERSAAP